MSRNISDISSVHNTNISDVLAPCIVIGLGALIILCLLKFYRIRKARQYHIQNHVINLKFKFTKSTERLTIEDGSDIATNALYENVYYANKKTSDKKEPKVSCVYNKVIADDKTAEKISYEANNVVQSVTTNCGPLRRDDSIYEAVDGAKTAGVYMDMSFGYNDSANQRAIDTIEIAENKSNIPLKYSSVIQILPQQISMDTPPVYENVQRENGGLYANMNVYPMDNESKYLTMDFKQSSRPTIDANKLPASKRNRSRVKQSFVKYFHRFTFRQNRSQNAKGLNNENKSATLDERKIKMGKSKRINSICTFDQEPKYENISFK